MSNYLIESSICLASFYGFYWLFLRGEKLLSVNRFYLVFTVLASMLIPLLNFESQFAFTSSVEASSTQSGVSESAILSSPFVSIEAIYLIGLVVSLCILVFKLLIVKRKVGKWPSWQNNNIEIIETEGNDAYSFFNTIFVGKKLNKNENLKQQIITHELAHIEGRHSLDLLVFELLKCMYWFNPFSYFYAKSIRIQHEYIADHSVLKRTPPKHYERSLLQFALAKVNSSLISSFSEHPIQKRLKMIHKLNSNIMNKLKPLFALPILGVLLIAYACTDIAEPELINEPGEVEEILIDLIVEESPYLEAPIETARTSDNEIIFEEIEVPLEVVEGYKVVEIRRPRYEVYDKKTLEGNPLINKTVTEEGIEIYEIHHDLITEKPVITVKGVKIGNN